MSSARLPWFLCKAGQDLGTGAFTEHQEFGRSCGSSGLFLHLLAGVVSCCQATVQEVPSSVTVAFIQPGRVVRGSFAFLISLAEKLQAGGSVGLSSHVCSGARLSLLVSAQQRVL